jgi:hypothetical protein
MSKIIEIFVFNVGHGDNLLIKFSTGTWGLIDFFYDGYQVEPPSLAFLKKLKGSIEIEFLHISHYHHDHTKGLEDVFKWIDDEKGRVKLKKLWLPGMIPTEKFHKLFNKVRFKKENLSEAKKNKKGEEVKLIAFKFKYLDVVIKKYSRNNSIEYLVSCKPYMVNNNYVAFCISPSCNIVNNILILYSKHCEELHQSVVKEAPFIDQNSLSTILFFSCLDDGCKTTRFAFGGDATRQGWLNGMAEFSSKRIVFSEEMQDLYSFFIKVSHHGSIHSSDVRVWSSLMDNHASEVIQFFISAGSDDHPHEETLLHIQHAAAVKKREFSIHITHKVNMAYQYAEEEIDLRPGVKGDAERRADAEDYKCRPRGPNKNFLGFKYSHDLSKKNVLIAKLIPSKDFVKDEV